MKQTIVTIVILLVTLLCAAQKNDKRILLPPSFTNGTTTEVDHISVYPPSAQLIAEEIEETEKNGTFYKVSILVPVNTTVKNSGTWETLDNGQLIWRLRLSSDGAKASALYFDKFDIPNGASVYVYTSDMKIVDGPYFRSDNPDGDAYMIGNIIGDDITIEYVAPMTKSYDGSVSSDNTAPIINIGEFGYVFRGEGGFERGTRATGFGSSESCEVNVNCSVGADWRIQQRGVARIYVVEGYNGGYCTGTLINNTSNDGTPYILTANHCGPSATVLNFRQWKFRFNYEASGCSNPSSESSIQYTDFTGCTKVAEGSNNGGSDFYLLKLSSFTTQNAINIGAIYNGWDRSSTAPTGGGAGIHHPSGDIKKISFFTSTPTTTSYNGGSDMTGASNAHWKITWVNSGSKTGVTEGGSSGSPIFNSAGRVFGTLSGGASSCSASSYSRYDLYGKMSFHWENSANGSTNAYKLKPWLDPNNTGATTCNYYDPANPGTTSNLSVSPTSLSYTANGGSKTITVTSNTSWTATSSASWLTISPASGSNNGTITATASANTSASQRSATITVSGNGATSITISVTQTGTNSSESIFTYDFESCTAWAVDNFAPCQTWDGDGLATGGIQNVSFTNSGYTGSYIAFQNGTANGFTAHGGTKFGCCMYATNGANNDWFITPAINITNGTTFSFWARSANNTYGLEQFRVAVSTDDENYTYIAGNSSSSISAPVAWTQFSYDLSNYAGRSLYIAIICVSEDVFAFFIDDIVVNSNAAVDANYVDNISIYPNPAKEIVNITLPEDNAQIDIVNVLGQTVKSVNTTSANETISLEGMEKGMYFFCIRMQDKTITKKVIVE
ncbi:MAG: choice-of-anchor J domain-containing protein [Bacteroidales bacterium]|nr:choice-of-anchor J domain-containing protein [Bacteroidales bacterium]